MTDFVLLLLFSWYFGQIKRVDAEKLLRWNPEPGKFLVRQSESKPGDYSLSLHDGIEPKHYRIRQLDAGGFFIARKAVFETLQDLVNHYSQYCITSNAEVVEVRGFLYTYI